MNIYKSCNCLQCRACAGTPKNRRHRRKVEAHRLWRRMAKSLLRAGDDISSFFVSTGYPS